MGQRNLAPGFTSAQNQTVEQQKKTLVRKQNQTRWPIQCHPILHPSCVQVNAISLFWDLPVLH